MHRFIFYIKAILITLLVLVSGCKDPYVVDYEGTDDSPVLIVEGFIDLNGNSSYRLSRTVSVNSESSSQSAPVTDARLNIESESGQKYTESVHSGEGNYLINHPHLPSGTRYRLKIFTSGREYLSEFVDTKVSPDISEINWTETAGGVDVSVTTQDTGSEIGYYRWEFEETWKFMSKYSSNLLFDGSRIRTRTQEEKNNICFLSAPSSQIQIASTEGFSSNTINGKVIQNIPKLSEKLGIRYSVLVKQYSITREGFLYWNVLQKNSENIGDIFGSMPTELTGNIICTSNPSEKVIGFVEAGVPKTKRIFIDLRDLSGSWPVDIDAYKDCSYAEIPIEDALSFFRNAVDIIPLYETYNTPGSDVATDYAYSSPACADCTKRGKLNGPDFWIEP